MNRGGGKRENNTGKNRKSCSGRRKIVENTKEVGRCDMRGKADPTKVILICGGEGEK